MPSPFGVARAVVLLIVFIVRTALIAVFALGVYLKTAGVVNVIALSMDCIAILIILVFLIHQYIYQSQPGNIRTIVTFGLLCLSGLIGSILLSVRARADHKRGLCHDFATLAHPCGVGNTVLGLSWLATAITIGGLLVDHIPRVIWVLSRIPPTLTKAPESHPPYSITTFSFPSCKEKVLEQSRITIGRGDEAITNGTGLV